MSREYLHNPDTFLNQISNWVLWSGANILKGTLLYPSGFEPSVSQTN